MLRERGVKLELKEQCGTGGADSRPQLGWKRCTVGNGSTSRLDKCELDVRVSTPPRCDSVCTTGAENWKARG